LFEPIMASAAERIIGLYQRHAIDWDRERGRYLFEKAWLDRFLALLSPNASILDIGCGAGEPISRYLIEQGCDVTGIDSSSTLIGMCQARFPHQEWIVADMRTLSLGRRFDGILAWDSFFHLCPEDQRQVFPIFRCHARPGAALMFTSGPGHGEAIGNFNGEPLYHGSLDGEEYRSLLNQNGFDVVKNAVKDLDCGFSTVWLAQIASSVPDPLNDQAGLR
jgi:SAM-dependent methyltransferase